MIDDFAYKVARKILPEQLYKSISWSFLGRSREWHRIESYSATFDFYLARKDRFEGRSVIEVGSGEQFHTALFFLHNGAAQVALIEPKLTMDEAKLAAQLEDYNGYASAHLRMVDVLDRIICYRDLSEVPESKNGTAGFICSYLVLEHFREIESFFRHLARLLSTDGISCNLVDLSDHTYHFLGKFGVLNGFATRRSLYHLRYSDRMFSLLNDPKCYINRRLLPEYLELASKFGLSVEKIEKRIDGRARINPDLIRRHPSAPVEDLRTVNFSMTLAKT